MLRLRVTYQQIQILCIFVISANPFRAVAAAPEFTEIAK
jgi:hypothetical protein